VFLDIATEPSEALVASLKDAAVAPRFFPCNLMNLDALRATFTEIDTVMGGVDILINNAANDDRHKSEDVTPPTGMSAWQSTCATSSSAPRPYCRACVNARAA
jgi:NAD(P)-dependent dehydrogenase (short-subunit alcohol dehydrogenase family)